MTYQDGRIGGVHEFIKVSSVPDKNSWDIVVCRKCGLRGERLSSMYYFPDHVTPNKVYNCKKDK